MKENYIKPLINAVNLNCEKMMFSVSADENSDFAKQSQFEDDGNNNFNYNTNLWGSVWEE